MSPMGEQIGSSLVKTKKIFLILFVCFILGLLITIAEPDLSVLANQVKEAIDPTLLIVTIGIGVGLFLVLAVCKIIFKMELTQLLMLFYLVVFGLSSILIANGSGALRYVLLVQLLLYYYLDVFQKVILIMRFQIMK